MNEESQCLKSLGGCQPNSLYGRVVFGNSRSLSNTYRPWECIVSIVVNPIASRKQRTSRRSGAPRRLHRTCASVPGRPPKLIIASSVSPTTPTPHAQCRASAGQQRPLREKAEPLSRASRGGMPTMSTPMATAPRVPANLSAYVDPSYQFPPCKIRGSSGGAILEYLNQLKIC